MDSKILVALVATGLLDAPTAAYLIMAGPSPTGRMGEAGLQALEARLRVKLAAYFNGLAQRVSEAV